MAHAPLVVKTPSQRGLPSVLLQAESVAERSRALNEAFTYALFINVCRSLFEAHKLMFSFLLAIKILQNRKEIDPGRCYRQGSSDAAIEQCAGQFVWSCCCLSNVQANLCGVVVA